MPFTKRGLADQRDHMIRAMASFLAYASMSPGVDPRKMFEMLEVITRATGDIAAAVSRLFPDLPPGPDEPPDCSFQKEQSAKLADA